MVRREQPPSLHDAVHRALRAWKQVDGTAEDLLERLLLVRARQQALDGDGSPTSARLVTNEILLEGLEALKQKDDLGAKILRERFLNGETVLKVAYRLNLSEYQVNRFQYAAIETLTKILDHREQNYRQEQVRQLEASLPPSTYFQLFGVEQTQISLLKTLQQGGSPWLVSITGLGGLGKTALADAVVRQLIPRLHYDRVLWLRADPHSLSGESLSPLLTFDDLITQLGRQLNPDGGPPPRWEHIRQQLKTIPSLVVVDNLETEADALYLFHQLGDLSGPSKFLLTSRTRPPAQAGVLTLSLSELPPPDALALIRHHAQIIGLSDLAEAPDEALGPILEVVGGNPLAIKLVISMALVLPLSHILADLPVGRMGKIEQLYRHIYRKAWQLLSPPARTLLQVMPVVAETGAQLGQLQAISKLTDEQLPAAIQELVARSLLETRGTTWDRRYGIHRLTETFLRTEIVDWPEEQPG